MKLKAIRLGLEILEQYVEDDVQITEIGGCLNVWNYSDLDIIMPNEAIERLKVLGWTVSSLYGWLFKLSG